MKMFLFYTIILSFCGGAFSDTFGSKPNKDTLIARLLAEADLVVRARMKSYWMPEKGGIETAELVVKETIFNKIQDNLRLIENGTLKIYKQTRRNTIDDLYFPDAEYVIFLFVNEEIKVGEKGTGLTPLNYGSYVLSPFEEIEVIKRIFPDEEERLQVLNKRKDTICTVTVIT